jgi:hypothetical protein
MRHRAQALAAALRLAALWLGLALAWAAPAAPPLKSIVILDFELIDDTYDKTDPETQRLAMIGERLRRAFADEGFYTVVDAAPAAALIARLRQSRELHDCDWCAQDIGRALGVDRVLVGWVQKVSRLILNIDLRIVDVAADRLVLQKSVDLRGNTDESWRRGIDFLVRDMREKGQGNR